MPKPVSFISGVAGFIASHVADELIHMGHDVIGMDDLSGGFRQNVPGQVKFFEGSILDRRQVHDIFKFYKPDYVFHLASFAAEGLSHFIRHYNYTENLIGSVNLINEAVKHNIRGFVFTSSMAVYGSQQVPYTETMIPRPEDPYGIAKYAVEQDLRTANEMFGLPYIIFRPHNVYGERQNIGDPYRNVIGIFMNQIMQGKPMTIFGDGEQVRAFSYISDIAPVIARSVRVPAALGRTINIGGESPISINTLADQVAQAMNVEGDTVHLPPRVEVKTAFSSHAVRREIFGNYIPIELWSGLERMAKWAKQRGPQSPTRLASIEIDRNLPEKWRKL